MSAEISKLAENIQLLICDVDGVLTDGRIFLHSDPHNSDGVIEMKVFHARDGHGLKLVQRGGITVAIISGRKAPIVKARMDTLGISEVHQGFSDKLPVFRSLCTRMGISAENVAYIGDDTIDLCVMREVGLPVAVADAHPKVKDAAKWVTTALGGQGAVRELCDLLLSAQNLPDE
jgi:3-deoxy-D-manno-octulosonate 8-phosphate phosphatase (KDO 8-P phosphatase)